MNGARIGMLKTTIPTLLKSIRRDLILVATVCCAVAVGSVCPGTAVCLSVSTTLLTTAAPTTGCALFSQFHNAKEAPLKHPK